MRFGLLNKDVPEKIFLFVKNDESVVLPAGEPLMYSMDATRDGHDVKKAAVAATATSFFAGVPVEDIPVGGSGWAQVYGFIPNLVLVRHVRANSGVSYSSAAAVAAGDQLNIQTLANAFTRSGAGAASAALPFAVAADTLASIESSTSTTSDTWTRVTTSIRAFLRAM